jgi:hypothetical protein
MPQMIKRNYMIAAMVLAQSVASWAQTTTSGIPPKEPVAAGAIIMPPKDDPAAVKKPREAVDPNIAAPPERKAKKKEKKTQYRASKGKSSKDAACKGPAELCKQSSPR